MPVPAAVASRLVAGASAAWRARASPAGGGLAARLRGWGSGGGWGGGCLDLF